MPPEEEEADRLSGAMVSGGVEDYVPYLLLLYSREVRKPTGTGRGINHGDTDK
jgi:hypothetical protein